MEHQRVFELYHEMGEPREWIVSLCQQTPMRVETIEPDGAGKIVLTLKSDPKPAVWQQDWFELVSKDLLMAEDDLFEI